MGVQARKEPPAYSIHTVRHTKFAPFADLSFFLPSLIHQQSEPVQHHQHRAAFMPHHTQW